MTNLIENLRKKDKPERQRAAFLVASLVTLIVGGLWATTLPTRLSFMSLEEAAAPKTIEVKEEMVAEKGPHWSDSLKATVAEGWSSLWFSTPKMEQTTSPDPQTESKKEWQAPSVSTPSQASVILIATSSPSTTTLNMVQ